MYNTPVSTRLWRKLIPMVILVLGLVLLAATTWPLPLDRAEWTTASPDSAASEYHFWLEWPTAIRRGDSRTARLTVQPPTAAAELRVVGARIEFTGITSGPPGNLAQPIGAAETLDFRWELQPVEAGVHSGTLWIYALPSAEDSLEQRVVLAARRLQVRAIFLGPVPAVWLRWSGVILVSLAGVLFIRRHSK